MVHIIDFEGLDCSFKETNSKELVKFIGTDKAKRYDFPAYHKKSSFFVRQFLKGRYENPPRLAILMAYMMDMYDRYTTEILPDIKNGIEYVILDRFWCSNLYYQATNENEYNEIIAYSHMLNLPTPDCIIKLIADKKVMFDFVHRKASGDILESDDTFLSNTYDRFVKCEFPVPTRTIYTTNGNSIKPREKIFSEILAELNNLGVYETWRYK